MLYSSLFIFILVVGLSAVNIFLSTNLWNEKGDQDATNNVVDFYQPSTSTNTAIDSEFERQDRVVIATKIHGEIQLHIMVQSLCLLHYAYNNRLNYDIVAFTTVPIKEAKLTALRKMMAPTNFTLIVDNIGLQQEISALSPIRRQKFLERCNVSSPENLTWWSKCPGRLAYNWQAEFRSLHLYRHPVLDQYRYMMWVDADSFPTQVWTRDPVSFLIQNQLAVLFDNFPQGMAKGHEVQRRVQQTFDRQLCNVRLVNGALHGKVVSGKGLGCPYARVSLIHGFFHVTDLDFYRSEKVQQFAENWIGDCFLCREYDDQGAITIPAAMLAPERSWDMRYHNLTLQVYHNFDFDGKERAKPSGFVSWWATHGEAKFPEAYDKCPIKSRG